MPQQVQVRITPEDNAMIQNVCILSSFIHFFSLFELNIVKVYFFTNFIVDGNDRMR